MLQQAEFFKHDGKHVSIGKVTWKAVAKGDHRMFLSLQDGAPSYVS